MYVCNTIQYIDPHADNRRKVICMSISLVSHVSCLSFLSSLMSLVSHVSHVSCLSCLSCFSCLMCHVSCLFSHVSSLVPRLSCLSSLISLIFHVSCLSRVSCVDIHPLADNIRKGRCIRRHGASATTPAATAGATSVGRAHVTMVIFLTNRQFL